MSPLVQGDLLRTIYVRIAMWIAKTASNVTVGATDAEIVGLLPHLIGPRAARRIGWSVAERKRAVSRMAFDWRSVIRQGATEKAENTDVAMTFYLEGGDGERRFSLAVDVGGIRVLERPIPGTAVPVSLVTIVEETKQFRLPYMQWAEFIHVAALNGDPVAKAAELFIKGGGAVAKGAGYVLAALLLGSLLFFAGAPRDAQARVIERVQRWLRSWAVKNETEDGRLPDRLRIPGKPFFRDENSEVQWISDTEAVFTLRHPDETLSRARKQHESYRTGHIEWEWNVILGDRAPICKHTENPQLHVTFDELTKNNQLAFACRPIVVVHGVSESFSVGVPDAAVGSQRPPKPGDLDLGDVLVIADPRTYNTCLPR